jgi:Flp pilus assembly protein TadG
VRTLRLAGFARCRRGSAALETAFALPIVLALGFGAADAGWLLSQVHRMKGGLVTGAHLLARSRDPVAAEARARNLAVTGRTTAGGAPRVKGWTPANVTVSYRMVDNTGGAYAGADRCASFGLETNIPYTGFGLLRLAGVTGAVRLTAAHEERWTGS